MSFDIESMFDDRKSRMWFHAESRCVDAIGFCQGELTSFSKSSPDKETPNEDSSAIFELGEEQGIIIVADGAGGHQAGDQASRIIVESLAEQLEQRDKEKPLRSAILDAIESANQTIIELGKGAASTVAVVEYDQGSIRCYHAGDSQVILCSNRGKIKYSTVAHSPTGLAVESGLMEESEAILHDERNLITNCVGDSEMRIEIGPTVPMTMRDTLLIASDGLFDNLLNDEIAEIIRKGGLLSQTETLLAISTERMVKPQEDMPGKPDDLTILCFRRGE